MAARDTTGETRRRLIRATMASLQENGSSGLTLESVARSAGVSKGGLLHHFPSKDALIEATLTQMFEDFAQRVEERLVGEPHTPGRLLRAYVYATFDDHDQSMPLELSALLILSISENERLLKLIRDDAQSWQRRLADDGVRPARAAVIRHAADAFWTDRMLGLAPEDAASRVALSDELIALIQEDMA